MGNPTTTAHRRSTPNQLRLWTAGMLLLTAAALAALTLAVADTQRGIHRVGREAAPQAQVTSDLYFALSDLDAQTARTLLTSGDADLQGPQLDAEISFNRRLTDVDDDLRRAVAGANDEVAQRTLQSMLDDIAYYHSLAARAVLLDSSPDDAPVGKTSAASLAFYSPATDLIHLDLIPAATALRDRYANELLRAAKDEHDAATTDAVLVLVSGLALLGALVGFQIVLRRRFGRALNPWIAVATVGTAALLAAGVTMNSQQSDRLQNAVTQHMAPYLDIQNARAVAYDATAAAIRYAVAPKFGYDRDFTKDAAGLKSPDGQGLLHTGLRQTDAALARSIGGDWSAVSADARKVMEAVDQGDAPSALATATGIGRGQLAFDFYALDTHLSWAATAQRDAFESGVAEARSGAAGWAGAPAVALGSVMILTLLGVRPRLAEYRA